MIVPGLFRTPTVYRIRAQMSSPFCGVWAGLGVVAGDLGAQVGILGHDVEQELVQGHALLLRFMGQAFVELLGQPQQEPAVEVLFDEGCVDPAILLPGGLQP